MSAFQLVYGSHARKPFTRPELAALLRDVRHRNQAAGLTGLLIYHDENFLQVLEGDEIIVEATYEKIRRDPRHAGCLVLHRGTVPEPQFSEWSMAFQAPTVEELAEAGLRDLRAPEVRRLGGPKVRAFINAFARTCNVLGTF